MSPRRRARGFALQALVAADAGSAGVECLANLWDARLDDDAETPDAPVSEEESTYAREVVEGVLAQRDALDGRIEGVSVNWRLPRMPLVDRNILRIGAWELFHRADVPGAVAINEGLELAKAYGGTESRAFVNGVLDKLASQAGRGGRK
jgi:N utilization substance protein B